MRAQAPLVDPMLLRAIDALLASQAGTEILLTVRDAIQEGAAEMRHAGHAVHAAQLVWLADYLGIEADARREWTLN